MVAKCANPSCSAKFLRLLEGKVSVAEVRIGPDALRERRYAWLCDKCADRMIVVFDDQTGEPYVVAVKGAAA